MTLADSTPQPPARHAVCGYVARGARVTSPFQVVRTEAFCGASVDPREGPVRAENCAACVLRAAEHAARCDCFKLWPGTARLPRPECRHPIDSIDPEGRCTDCGKAL